MKAVPVREIHEIELSSVCNLACRYCPHPKLERPKDHMSWEVFERTLEHVRYLCRKGTQGEVSLTGIGEAVLHPQFVEMAVHVRAVIGWGRDLVLATNGVSMTPELARQLAELRVIVYVSTHRPEKAGPAFEMLKAARTTLGKNVAFVDSAIDWAGQVKWYVSAERRPCTYLQAGWVAVRQDGAINTCCMDAHSKYPIATVFDEPGTLMTRATTLCGGCHLTVPEHMREEVAA